MHRNDGSRYLAIAGASLAAIAALAGTLTFTFHMGDLSGRSDAQAQGYAAAYSTDTKKQIADCWTKADRSAAQECVSSAIQASREAKRSEVDLSTQQQMSDWAFWALVVAIVMAFVTTIGTYLIFRQVELTRKAVGDSGEATKAMLEANEIAREGMRPWLSLQVTAATDIYPPSQGGSVVTQTTGTVDVLFTVQINNIGKTTCSFLCRVWLDQFELDNQLDLSGSIMPNDNICYVEKKISIPMNKLTFFSYIDLKGNEEVFILINATVDCKYTWPAGSGRTAKSYRLSEFPKIHGFRFREARRHIPTFLFDQENARIE